MIIITQTSKKLVALYFLSDNLFTIIESVRDTIKRFHELICVNILGFLADSIILSLDF